MSDPVEEIVEIALNDAGIGYVRAERMRDMPNLDFYLPDHGIYIECKRFSTPRTAEQIEDVNNVILLQGLEAAYFFAALLDRAT